MKYLLGLTLSVILIVLTGCGPNSPGVSPWATTQKVYGFSFINGTVIENFGDKVIVEIEDKDVVTGTSYEDTLTNKVIKNSLFIVGMNTSIGKEKAIVSDIRGNQVTFDIQNTKLKNNQNVKIYIPKKTIAIMDFSVIGMESNNINKFALEDMTTKIVQSGQYIVVERSKLDTILKEQKLADSGLLDESSASKVGKLLSADIILTGTFAKRGNKFKANLRLVDVATGIILVAINETIDANQFSIGQSKDSSNFKEDFEDNKLAKGWIKRVVNLKGSKSKSNIDNTTGANGTKSSLKINYFLPRGNSVAVLPNNRMRDASNYKGIKFYAKASSTTTISVVMFDQDFENKNNYNKWVKLRTIDTSWDMYQVPFNEFTISKFADLTKGEGDGVLDVDNISQINFGILGRLNEQNKNNSLWIDEISFY